jgi:hypothetical protein
MMMHAISLIVPCDDSVTIAELRIQLDARLEQAPVLARMPRPQDPAEAERIHWSAISILSGIGRG